MKTKTKPRAQAKPQNHSSILVVDDDDNFRETLSDAMALKGVPVDGAGSCEAASRQLLDNRPSLILLDVQLPDTNGLEFCRTLKQDERYQDVPVVLLSARYTEPADRAEGMLAGAASYLSKPLSLDCLWDEVSYLLDR